MDRHQASAWWPPVTGPWTPWGHQKPTIAPYGTRPRCHQRPGAPGLRACNHATAQAAQKWSVPSLIRNLVDHLVEPPLCCRRFVVSTTPPRRAAESRRRFRLRAPSHPAVHNILSALALVCSASPCLSPPRSRRACAFPPPAAFARSVLSFYSRVHLSCL